MSGVGVSELVILLFIGLIVLGPERLPRVANQIGNWIGQARRMTRVMRRQLEEEINLEKSPDIQPPKSKSTMAQADTAAGDEADVAANEHDDTYSPAHDRSSFGTGANSEVGDNEGVEAEEPVASETDDNAVDRKDPPS